MMEEDLGSKSGMTFHIGADIGESNTEYVPRSSIQESPAGCKITTPVGFSIEGTPTINMTDSVAVPFEDGGLENLAFQEDDDILTYMPRNKDSIKSIMSLSSQDTKEGFTRTFTMDPGPRIDHYSNILDKNSADTVKRPTLSELHEQVCHDYQRISYTGNEKLVTEEPETTATDAKQEKQHEGVKFGWIKGVLIRCVLNIWGVMLFLRLSWVTGQAGIGLAILVILLATTVTSLTALSLSAICTNGEVKGGGAYYILSRSLGPEFGGAIGLIFSLANTVAVAMYVIGFAETIRDILKDHDMLIVSEVHDIRIIGLITSVGVLGIALIGMKWETMAQIGLLIILLVAIWDFIIGCFIPPTNHTQIAKGFVGFRGQTFAENFGPDFRDGQGFFSVFAIFFPAATGIMAGANISGDLKDAQNAIPKGTLLAIFFTSSTYLVMAILAGAAVVRDASGLTYYDLMVESLKNNSLNASLLNDTVNMLDFKDTPVAEDIFAPVPCNMTTACKFGLMNDMQVMQLVSIWGPLILAGIFCATLSSALASMVSAPKVFQAVCKDRIFPGIHVFAKGYGKSQEPRRAYALVYTIAVACICIGDLNAIAPLISNFFLISYCLVNYACFDVCIAKPPGWRPRFRYYSRWLSLIGAALCLAVMFVISWYTALITFAVVFGLFLYVHYKKPDINWGSSTQAHVYRNALQSAKKLLTVEDHVKTYRPSTLVLCGSPADRPALVDFAHNYTKKTALLILGHVIQSDGPPQLKDMREKSKAATAFLRNRKVKGFYSPIIDNDRRHGVQALLQTAGLGKLRPNIVLLGFKTDWSHSTPEAIEQYVAIIHDAFDLYYGVAILRVQGGLQTSMYMDPEDDSSFSTSTQSLHNSTDEKVVNIPVYVDKTNIPMSTMTDVKNNKNGTFIHVDAVPQTNGSVKRKLPQINISHINEKLGRSRSPLSSDPMDRFSGQQSKGTIDVWWLFDDGGLTVLIPHLLRTKSYWRSCNLRVFCIGNDPEKLEAEQKHLESLLAKFRFDYQSLHIITGLEKRPRIDTYNDFKLRIQSWTFDPNSDETPQTHPWKISSSQLSRNKEKTMRHLRLREVLQEHSSDARLIVLTLPIPRKGISTALYLAWLDTLTHNMPPTLLLRGNQETVLTYHS